MATAELLTPGGGLGHGFNNTAWPGTVTGLVSPNTEAIMKDILGDGYGDGNHFAEAFSQAMNNNASLLTTSSSSIPASDPALYSASASDMGMTSGPFAFNPSAAGINFGLLNDRSQSQAQATASPRRLTLNPLEHESTVPASAIASFTESPKVSTEKSPSTKVSSPASAPPRGSKRRRTDSDDSKTYKSRRNSDSSRPVTEDDDESTDSKKRVQKTTSRKALKSEKETSSMSPQEQAKQRRLERNRIAATKWRLKKKSHINHLERDYNRYKEEYGTMREFASGLRNQVVELKTQLLLWQNQVRAIANAAENAGVDIDVPCFPLTDLSLKEQVDSQIPSLPAVYHDDYYGDHEHDLDGSSLDLEEY